MKRLQSVIRIICKLSIEYIFVTVANDRQLEFAAPWDTVIYSEVILIILFI